MRMQMGSVLFLLAGAGVASAGGNSSPLFLGSPAPTPINTAFCQKYACSYLGWYTSKNDFFDYKVRGYRLNTDDLFEVAWTIRPDRKIEVYNLRLTAKSSRKTLLDDYIFLSTNKTQKFDLTERCALLKYPVNDARNYAEDRPVPVTSILRFSRLPIANGNYSMEFNCGRFGNTFRLVTRGGGSDTYWFEAPVFKAGQP